MKIVLSRIKIVSLLSALLFVFQSVWAGSWLNVFKSSRDFSKDEIAERARLRLYPGGQDEEPLEVQKDLIRPRGGSAYLLQKRFLAAEEDPAAKPTQGSSSDEGWLD